MSTPELAGFGEIMGELRVARPAAPQGLPAQVLVLGEPASRRQRSLRRPALLLAPAGLAAAAAAAVVIGVVQSGGEQQPVVLRQSAVKGPAPLTKELAPTATDAAGLPATRSRAQRYQAELTLRVNDLSAQTKHALRLTRSLRGYVRTVDYGQGQKTGSAYLVVRIPVRRVQEAIVRFSALGTILGQHVSIQDVQPSIGRRYRQIQVLRRRIAALEGQTSPEAKALLEELNRRLTALQREQAQTLRSASFATVSLALRTKDAAVAPPAPGRIERTFDRAGTVLLQELAVLVYVVVVALPLLILAAAAYLAARSLRRRSLDRLLESS
jgi:Domain of unknown function (DUF4349)